MIVVGIDPGESGAIAFLNDDGALNILDMPTLQIGKTKKRSLDYHALAASLRIPQGIAHAFVEQTWNRPGKGSSGALMACYAAALATLTTLDIPWTVVAPQTWKKALGVPAAKDGARARASQLMPAHAGQWRRVKDDGRAEASLIALYGMRTLDRQMGRAT